eukprot:Ihof_evm1s487 gene=Ihof_evmTU1s487
MSLVSFLHGVGESLMPVLKNSKFKETGVLTPEEFVAAGDFLVFKCPTWSWASGEESKRRPYLPADKQFLITKNVPCFKRVKNMEYTNEDEKLVPSTVGLDDWVDTFHSQHRVPGMEEDLKEMTINDRPEVRVAPVNEAGDDDDDDIPDMDEFEEDNLEPEQSELQEHREDDNILKTRTYDISITYDKYYQTPRLWLVGYDEHDKPLSSKGMFEDFSQDHAKKTVTMEGHPHLSVTMASIHPCRHAHVMKRIIDNMTVEKEGEGELLVY